MDGDGGAVVPEERSSSPGGGGPGSGVRKPKVVVIMGPTGSGKSRLAIDLAAHLPVEVVSADSMQVYRGLDVLPNKVPLDEQQGVPHHLLGTVSPNVEFTAKAFRDSAVPLIDEILSRDNLPVIVGGTNYYSQLIPVWWRWYYWCSPVAWTIYGIFTSQIGDKKEDLTIDGLGALPIDEFLKESLGFDYDFLVPVALAHIGWVLGFFFIFACGFKFLNFQRR